MEVMAFFPCEQVITRWNGTKDILNFGLRRINIRVKEEEHEIRRKISIVCRLAHTAAEKGKKSLDLSLMSMDGKVTGTVSFKYEVPASTGEVDIAGAMPLTVEESGRYVIIATMDGFEIARWPLSIQLVYEQPGEGPDKGQGK